MSAISQTAPASLATADHARVTGIGFGIAAGAVWGLVYLAPALVPGFSPLMLAAGRYLCFGLTAAALVAPRWRRLSRALSARHWLALVWLSLVGNTLYYVLLAAAVQMGGIAITSLVIGFLPVTVTIIGSRDRGAVPLARLWPSLACCAAGALCIGAQAWTRAGQATHPAALAGLACALGALVSWTAYAVGNSRWIGRLGPVSVGDWNLAMGVVTGAQGLALVPLALALDAGGHSGGDWARLTCVAVGVTALASFAGNGLWNRMCRLLPLTLVGQMILFETLFALLYGLLWEHRLPHGLEVAALVLAICGVVGCLAAHRRAEG